jgi:hypothetical protein
VGDFVAPLVPLGLMFGRIGNFINGELWGRPADPALPWAMIFPQAGDDIPRHPSQLYQAGLEGLALFVILWLYTARPRPVGAASGLFLIGYGVFRFIAEYFRTPDDGILRVSKEELVAVLAQFNPWWRGEAIADLPKWRRAAFRELHAWMTAPPAPRAVMLSGARQIGKTTLMLQAADALLRAGVPAANILYATFDHPILKLAGIEAVVDAWREREPRAEGPDYLLLDEAQFIRDWGTWVKHQVDFRKDRRIAFTGSAMPLVEADQESGVGRWHTIRLTTLSFYEYLQIKRLQLPDCPLRSLRDLFDWAPADFYRVTEAAAETTSVTSTSTWCAAAFPRPRRWTASRRRSACCARTSSTRCSSAT